MRARSKGIGAASWCTSARLELSQGADEIATGSREEAPAARRGSLSRMPRQPLRIAREPRELLLSLVEPAERHESLHEIGDEPGETRFVHLLLTRKGHERREHVRCGGVAPERSSSRPSAAVANCSAGRPEVLPASSSARAAPARTDASSPR